MNINLNNTDYKQTKLYKLGYKIKIPEVFIDKFVEIWNKRYKTKINKEQAHYYIVSLIENIIIILDNGFSLILNKFCTFTTRILDVRLNVGNTDYRIKEDNKEVRVSINKKLQKRVKKNINPTKEYQDFLDEKAEIRELMIQQHLERRRHAKGDF